ncbi:hypothetical protein [Streptomyces himalayensis]|uniref:Uncharacterized protein n=1 Tax=Streptomyces himalayensis subsp. himalayensis TaxID=2756131 RepID=A0A7W0DUC0_9ACTN|nr:hypothetical protein [Streptomyces himalayensis]MBA2951421.1 hypothetical protein [Streptomyces himalayensis subsp. himalayensis]
MSFEKNEAYRRLAEAVDDVNRLEGGDGVLTEWLVITSTQRYESDGTHVTQVGTLLPDGGGQVPHHRLMGLLDFAQTRLRAEVAWDDD